MELKRKYVLVGALWGVIVGYGAIAIATGLGVAFLFTLVYREGPWGENTGALLYGLGVAGFLGSVVLCTGMGYFFGRRAQRASGPEQATEHRRANVLLGTGLLAVLLGAYQLNAQNTATINRQGNLDRLIESRQIVSDLHAAHRGDGHGLDVAMSTRGERAGPYVVEVTVRDGRGRMLHSERHEIELPGHEGYRVFPVDYPDLLRRALERDHSGQETVHHRDLLTIAARLVPVLDRRELRGLPRHAASNYLAPDSPFFSRRETQYPIEFRFERGQYWVVVRGELQRVAS